MTLQQGTKAPAFTLKDAQEKEHRLKDYEGKWVVLYFYPKDNTPGCTIEANEFTALAKEFEKEKAVILGVSPDNCASHQKFIDKQKLAITLLADIEKETAKNYAVWGPKKFLGKEFLGIKRSTYLIDPKGTITYVWPKVKAKGHAQEVLEKLKENKP